MLLEFCTLYLSLKQEYIIKALKLSLSAYPKSKMNSFLKAAYLMEDQTEIMKQINR